MRAYASLLQQKKVSPPSVQAALDSLREKGLVWRAAYGDYALEDESMASWYKIRTQN
jgi:Mn-dependent DtxR family transcriptional regulator